MNEGSAEEPASLQVRNILEAIPDDEQMHIIPWRMYIPVPEDHVTGNEECAPIHICHYIDVYNKVISGNGNLGKAIVKKKNYQDGAKLTMGNHLFQRQYMPKIDASIIYAHFFARSTNHLRKKTVFLHLNIVSDLTINDTDIDNKRNDYLDVLNERVNLFTYANIYIQRYGLEKKDLIYSPIYQNTKDAPEIKYYGRKRITLPMLEGECKKLIDGLMNDLRDKQVQLKTISAPDLMNDIVSSCGIIGKRLTLLTEARNYLYKFVE